MKISRGSQITLVSINLEVQIREDIEGSKILLTIILEVTKDRKRIDLFVHIVIFMVIPLRNVTKFMAIHLVPSQDQEILIHFPVITVLLI